MTDNRDILARIAELQKQIDELKAHHNRPPPQFTPEPYQPRDWTAGATMDRETKRDLAKAFPDSLVRDLRSDAFKPNPVTGATPAQLTPDRPGGVQITRGTGYRDAVPLGPPPGISLLDKLVDAQDALDRADRERRLGTTVKGQSK
jgi:hypothetical protein